MREISQVSEVLIHVDSEGDIDENRYRLMPPHAEIEKEIQKAARSCKAVRGVSDIQCHYLEGMLEVQCSISVNPQMPVFEAEKIARNLKQEMEKIPDIHNIDIHLKLR